MTRQAGFTAIELVSLIVLAGILGLIAYFLMIDFQKISDDKERKTAINAIHQSLQEVYYQKNQSYPKNIDTRVLSSVEPTLFKDPDGRQINTTGSDYRYEATGCIENSCKAYYLYANLEKEARYEKRSDQ